MDSRNRISITICGDGGCGKTSITLRLVKSAWVHDYDPTIEDCYSITRNYDGATYHITLTDTAGQEEYRSLWAHRNLAADAFLLVYDITSPPSLPGLEYYNTLIEVEADTRLDFVNDIPSTGFIGAKGKRHRKPAPALDQARETSDGRKNLTRPVKLVAGNKCDLSASREVTAKTGLDWARGRGCAFMETSAKDCVNVEESLEIIVRRVVEARYAGVMWARGEEERIEAEKVGRRVVWDLGSIREEEERTIGSGNAGSVASTLGSTNAPRPPPRKKSFWRKFKS